MLLASDAVVGAPAHAVTVTPNANLRPCVDLANANCSSVGTTGQTSVIQMRCWRDGSWATGAYRSNRWFLLFLSDGREGYVHSSYVGSQVATPNCRDLAYVRAADWAIAQIGQYYQPGTNLLWSGWCARFVRNAFTQGAGVSYPSANAIDQYRYFKSRNLIYGGLPRYGDPVFYDISAPYGHTAIYVGGTTVVTTQGTGQWLPVARRDLYSFARYLGWAAV